MKTTLGAIVIVAFFTCIAAAQEDERVHVATADWGTDMAVCDRIEHQNAAQLEYLEKKHQACLDQKTGKAGSFPVSCPSDSGGREAGQCTYSGCVSLHVMQCEFRMQARQAADTCRASVRERLERERQQSFQRGPREAGSTGPILQWPQSKASVPAVDADAETDAEEPMKTSPAAPAAVPSFVPEAATRSSLSLPSFDSLRDRQHIGNDLFAITPKPRWISRGENLLAWIEFVAKSRSESHRLERAIFLTEQAAPLLFKPSLESGAVAGSVFEVVPSTIQRTVSDSLLRLDTVLAEPNDWAAYDRASDFSSMVVDIGKSMCAVCKQSMQIEAVVRGTWADLARLLQGGTQ